MTKHPYPQNHSRNGPAQQRRRERQAADRHAAAEEAEAVLPREEREVLEMTDIAKQAAEQAKDVRETQDDETEKVATIKEAHKKIEEIIDEFVPNSEYESSNHSKDDPPNESNPVKENPPPVRDRTLGGIDYYTLSYDDPIFKNRYK